MCNLLVNTNRDMKTRYNKDRESTVYTSDYLSKRNQKAYPQWVRLQTHHQALTLSSKDIFLSRNRHRVWSLTHLGAIKEESKVANRDWVDHQVSSLLQYINTIAIFL